MLRSKLPRSTSVIAVAALCLTGTAGATAASLITGKQVKNGSITGADIKRGSLSASDLSEAARSALGSPALQGPAGEPGPSGPAGAAGPAGPGGVARVLTAGTTNVAVGTAEKPVVELPLQTGLFALDGKLTVSSQGGDDNCALKAAGGGVLDNAEFTVPGDSAAARMQVLLQGELDNSSGPARVRITCDADDQLTVRDARIRALEVGQLG